MPEADARPRARLARAMAILALVFMALGTLMVANTFGPLGPAEAEPGFAPDWGAAVLTSVNGYAAAAVALVALVVAQRRTVLRIAAVIVLAFGGLYAWFGWSILLDPSVPFVAKPLSNALVGGAMMAAGAFGLSQTAARLSDQNPRREP